MQQYGHEWFDATSLVFLILSSMSKRCNYSCSSPIVILNDIMIFPSYINSFSGEAASSILLAKVTEGIKGLQNQSKTSERYSGLEKGPATYGLVKQLRDNDMDLHSNQQVGAGLVLQNFVFK